MGDAVFEPFLEVLNRFDDSLPDWMLVYKRWIGICAVAAIIGGLMYFLMSLLSLTFPNSWFVKMFGNLVNS
ncbi:MAG: hypothetical protein AB7F75_05350 [Planctomycetota bacterium]